jgi:hypothetical protein
VLVAIGIYGLRTRAMQWSMLLLAFFLCCVTVLNLDLTVADVLLHTTWPCHPFVALCYILSTIRDAGTQTWCTNKYEDSISIISK